MPILIKTGAYPKNRFVIGLKGIITVIHNPYGYSFHSIVKNLKLYPYLEGSNDSPRIHMKLDNLIERFKAQQKNQYQVAATGWKQRVKKLHALQQAIEKTYRKPLQDALLADFGKPTIETDLTEIYQVVKEIKHAKKQLRHWMAARKVPTPSALLGTTSWYRYEPKGVCLIISPWNFPVNLTFGPLVAAIAAGNAAILKPSEMTPHTTAVMGQIIADLFPENEVALVEGGIEVSTALLALPFHHIFFTGSPRVGKIVMKAAAEHLSSVTLELGGKSPCIVDETADIKGAAKKIAWGKFLNSGQICITPDYLLVQESVADRLGQALEKQVRSFFGPQPIASHSYARIVNNSHFKRLVNHLEDALDKGAVLSFGGTYEADSRYMAPTLLRKVPETATLMQEEIFGPLLPMVTYRNTEEAIQYINAREKALSLYIFSKNRKSTNHILKQTRAGSSCVNTNLLQYSNHHLPFGGVNNSGIGKSHGIYGFKEFSNQRAVLKQTFPTAMELLFPPYNSFKQRVANITLRWF